MIREELKNEQNSVKHDEAGFREIVNVHSRFLYTHIRSIVLDHDDTNDVLQNTFIKAWQNLDGFRNEASLSTWLFSIATNESLQHLRRKKLRKIFVGSKYSNTEPMAQATDSNDGESIRRKLEIAMQTLSVQQRMVFGLKYFNDLKYSDIAKILNLSEGTLKAVYHIAVKKIEKYIKANV